MLPSQQASEKIFKFLEGETTMKRYIRLFDNESNMYDAKYVIEIVFNYGPKYEDVAASARVMHPKNIRKIDRLTDAQLRNFNDLVDSMIGPLVKRNFIIKDEYQSKKSYAYYVDFYPVDREGCKFKDEVRIIFRASDHDLVHGEEGLVAEDLILKSFTLMGKTYTDPFALQRKVIDICEHLMDGDFMYVVNVDT